MGKFKPMLDIGAMSISRRIVATLQQAGAEIIVVVTGYNAEALERHLANNGIVFLRNEDYEHTYMFDSAKIGLEYIKDKCDRILFTPVDIPLFTSATVKTLMESDARLACPTFNGETGHPIIISSRLVDTILADFGEGGLAGAFSRCGVEMEHIEVEDEGILHDADTPQDYQKLLHFHNEQLVRPVVSLALVREKNFFDEQMAMLLRQIDETSSVRTACQRMQISYSTGWNRIRTLESQMGKSLIKRNQGGSGGGRSSLTPDGEDLLRRYETYIAKVRDFAKEQYPLFFKDAF